MKLALQLGYWGAQPPADAPGQDPRSRAAGLRCRVHRRVVGQRRLHPAGLVGVADVPHQAGDLDRAAVGPHPGRHRHARPDPRPPLRTAATSSASACRVPRWSKAGTASPSASRWPAPGSTSTSSARSSPERRRSPTTDRTIPSPTTVPAASACGKPLRSIVHPLRADLPIWSGAEGPKNVALAAEIADGWLPIYYSPRVGDMYRSWLAEGFARPGRPAHRRHVRDRHQLPGRRHRRHRGRRSTP